MVLHVEPAGHAVHALIRPAQVAKVGFVNRVQWEGHMLIDLGQLVHRQCG